MEFFLLPILIKKKQIVSLIRDKWGTKPLFFSISKEKLYACSSLRLLASLLEVTEDQASIDTFNQLGFFYGDTTPFNEIKKVKPGGISNFFLKENKIYKKFKSFSSNKESFTSDSIENALKSQLISDVPIGLLLSGGVDSSILAYHMSKSSDSIFFNVTSEIFKNLDESSNTKIIENKLNKKIKKLFINEELLKNSLNASIDSLDLPVSDSSIILNYLIYKLIKKEGVPVCLTGVGADELFGGYTRFKILDFIFILNLLKILIPKFIFKLLSKFIKNPRLKKFTKNGFSNYLDLFSDTKNFKKNNLIVNLNKREILNFERYEYLTNSLLSFTDGISMHHSIEARVPYLSNLVSTDEILNNKYFSPNKYYLKKIRKSLYKNKFQEEKKGFAIKNDELKQQFKDQEVINRGDFGSIVLARWMKNLDNNLKNVS